MKSVEGCCVVYQKLRYFWQESRWSRFQTVRAEILRLVESLQVLPETVLEQVVVSKEPGKFHLTQSNLTSVDDYLQRVRNPTPTL